MPLLPGRSTLLFDPAPPLPSDVVAFVRESALVPANKDKRATWQQVIDMVADNLLGKDMPADVQVLDLDADGYNMGVTVFDNNPGSPTRGLFFQSKKALTAPIPPPILPTNPDDEPNWLNVPVTAPYNPRVTLAQQAVLAQVNTNTLSVDKLYRIIRRRYMTEGGSGSVGIEDKPDIYAYALTGSQFAPIAYQFDNGVITAGSYDVETDTFTADVAASYVRLVGDPADKNVIIGPPDDSNSIGAGGSNFIQGGESNTIVDGYANTMCNNTSCTIQGGSYNAMYSCDGCTIPSDSNYITLLSCTPGFTAPSGVSNKTYINNREYIDPYAVPGALQTAVVAGTFPTSGNTSGELQGAQPAGSVRGMKFKKGPWKYEYMPGDAGTDVWVRTPAG